MKTKPRRVDFENNREDLQVALLAECGFYASAIASKTGMSQGQVYYRNRKAGISIRDYRRGLNWVARVQVNWINDDQTRNAMRNRIRANMKKIRRATR